jgi:DNA (cytosine-5)-methyltransferase 1
MNKVIDFFSGCGGLSQGFVESGFEIKYPIDSEKMFLETFNHNIINSDCLNLDLFQDYNFKKLGKTDVIVAGPPCQGFSLTGPRKINDPRNKLYMSVLKAINILNPKAFLIENVRGLLTMWNGTVFKEILNELSKMNYNVNFKLIDSANYGVPQHRIRIFIVGTRKDLASFEFPKEDFAKDSYVTCREAIGDLPSLEEDPGKEMVEHNYLIKNKTSFQKYVMNSKFLYNHVATAHKKFVVDVIKLVPEGGNYKNLPKGIGLSRKFNEAWTRYHGNKPSRTIDTGHRNHFHYKYNRVPTIRENARLQTFKDSFKFLGTKTSQNVQVGNAVPPLLAFKIAKELKKVL